MKKRLGPVWFLIAIAAIIGGITIIPNAKELFEDYSILFYVAVLVIVGYTIIRILNQEVK